MSDTGGVDTVTGAGIARRLGIGRAAVTNWRRRYPDFPAPVADGPSPRFAWSEVERWLVATGKGDQLTRIGRTATGTQRLDRQDHPPSGGPHDPSPSVSSEETLARAMVALLPDREERDEEPRSVLDPSCGTGARLLAAADRYDGRVALVGRDADEDARENARRQLRHHPRAPISDVDIDGPLPLADAVVCVADARTPPSDAAPGDVALAWVRRCVELLRPCGVAVVAVPVLAAARASGSPARAALVRQGWLRDVVALPPMPDAPDRLLWVLRHTADRGDDVSMIDLSGIADPADVPLRLRSWHGSVDGGDPSTVLRVSRVTLLDGITDLTPVRYLGQSAVSAAAALGDLTARLGVLYAQVAAALPRPTPSASRPPRELVTIAELERRGDLTIMVRDASAHEGDVLLRTAGRPPVVADGSEGPAGVAQIVAVHGVDAHFVALFLRPEVDGLPVASTHGGVSRDDLRRCRLPRMPLAEQRRYGDAFRRLDALHQLTNDLARATGSVLDQTVHALTTGDLLPRTPARTSLNEGDTA